MAVQGDWKVLVAGWVFTTASEFLVVRFNPDGSLDSSFGNSGKVAVQLGSTAYPGSIANALAILPDGKIVVGGYANDSAGNGDLLLVRLNPDGSFDSSFGTGGVVLAPLGGGPNGSQWAEADHLALQPDGKIVASGYDYNSGSPQSVLIRLNPDGTVDSSFANGGTLVTQLGDGCSSCGTPPLGNDALAVQADGKILGAGTADDPASSDASLIIRLNGDGGFDHTFGSGGKVVDDLGTHLAGGRSSDLRALVLQANGKILVGGFGNDSTSNGAFLVARLNSDGSLDSAFGTAGEVLSQLGTTSPPQSAVHALAVGPEGKVVAAGYVQDTDGYGKLMVARLIADRPPTASFTTSPTSVPAGSPVSFNGSASRDPDGTIASYAWNFGEWHHRQCRHTGSRVCPSWDVHRHPDGNRRRCPHRDRHRRRNCHRSPPHQPAPACQPPAPA